jgi:diguanylate cyclase (GGDEF)-like protein
MIAAPDRRHLACLYLDLDGFKAVNDRYGHNVGDQLLSEVGRAVSRCVRGTDVVARLGGDEFTVVAEGVAGPDEAQLVADRIIRAVGAIRTVAGQDVEVSASIGISFLPADAPAPTHELLRSADQAMYAAKRAGKGCSRLAEPLAPAPVPVG